MLQLRSQIYQFSVFHFTFYEKCNSLVIVTGILYHVGVEHHQRDTAGKIN